MLKPIFTVLLVLVALSLSCAHRAPYKSVRIGKESSGKAVNNLNVQDTLIVTVSFMGPFSWHIAKIDTSILRLMDSVKQYDQPPTPAGSGKETFRFFAKEIGSTDLKLLYYPGFDTINPPADSFAVHLNLSAILPD
jgi:hypothetical protein